MKLSLVRYLHESFAEMRKITWPAKPDVLKYSAMVVAITLGTGVFFFLLDWVFSLGMSKLLGY